MMPPPPARPGLSNEDPSEFNLYQLAGGRSHLTLTIVLVLLNFLLGPRKANSVALARVSEAVSLILLCCHIIALIKH